MHGNISEQLQNLMCANYSYIHNFIMAHEIWGIKSRMKELSIISCFKKPTTKINLNMVTTFPLTYNYLIRLEVLIDLKSLISENFYKKLSFKKQAFCGVECNCDVISCFLEPAFVWFGKFQK